MVVRYETTPEGTVAAYWYRWRTYGSFRLGVLAFGLVPAILAFSLMSAAVPRNRWLPVLIALIIGLSSPVLVAALLRKLSRRGPRELMIDSDGVSTTFAGGQWEVGWNAVTAVASTADSIFIFGRGINSVTIPTGAFADEAERSEFLRRVERYRQAQSS